MASTKPPAWAVALVRAQHQLSAEMAEIRALLERQTGSGARDGADRDVLHALAGIVGGERFLARRIFDVAPIELELRQALTAATIDNAFDLGRLLARFARSGLAERAGRGREGRYWRLVSSVATSAHRHAAAS
jgi:hypothetical protein